MSMSEEFSLRNQWAALRTGKKWILACTLAAALGSGLFSLLQPKIFGARTLLLVSESRITEPDTKISNFVYYELLRTYETFIFNDSLIKKTIEHFGLEKAPYSLTVERFRRNRMLQVSLQKNTRLLEVSVEFPDARLAADIANFFAAQAVDLNETMNAKDRERATRFFRGEMERASQDLESSNTRLTQFKTASGVEEAPELVQRQMEQLSGNEVKLNELKVKLAGSVAKRQELAGRQASQSETAQASLEVLALTSEIEALQKALQQNSLKLARLRQDKALKEGTLRQLELENQLAGENYAALRKKFQEASVTVSARTIELGQVAPALPGDRPIRPRIPLNISLGAVFGLVASTLVTLVLQKFSTTQNEPMQGRNEERLHEIRRSGKGY
jgi:uncharacterized protein involved in exopolysaccharide biosynthesis